MPQLKHARLKASDACSFSFSVDDSTPTSCFATHSFFSASQTDTVQKSLSPIISCERLQFMGPYVSSRILWSTLASL